MSSALTATCPACQADINDDDATCGRCGAAVSAWPVVERTPLILPGNPALSDDLFRGKAAPVRVIGAAVLGFAAVLGVLVGSAYGMRHSVHMSPRHLKLLMAGVLLTVAALMLWRLS